MDSANNNISQFDVFVSTQPFGSISSEPLDVLRQRSIHVEFNQYGRKITQEELKVHIKDKDALIAGTERIDKSVLDCAKNLKLIARVGIGIDSVDFEEVKKRGIILTYTPNAVSQAVAELTIANMLNAARLIPQIHMDMKERRWNRKIGFEIAGKTIGLIGFGRVGQRVAKMLQGFSCRILVNDIAPDQEAGSRYNVSWATKEEIYSQADIISLHVPSTPLTYNMIKEEEFEIMEPHVCLINTSRGGIIEENALYHVLMTRKIGFAAIDVYEQEPYVGPLCKLDNIILTAHSGSCSREARGMMELEAAREVVQFITGKPPIQIVPDDIVQMEKSVYSSKVNLEWHEIVNQVTERNNERYITYRKRWNQYPAHNIVGPNPLSVDIELVQNPIEKFENCKMEDYLLSPFDPRARLMEVPLFEKIMEEFARTPEPMAIKLGVRGCAINYPYLQEVFRMIREIDCVEVLTSVHYDHLEAITSSLLDSMIEFHLDVLNIFIDENNQRNISLDVIAEIKKRKSIRKADWPKIRVVGNVNREDLKAIDAFAEFWKPWADFVALSAPVDSTMKVSHPEWDCYRLWQRLMISATGKVLACSFDVQEHFCLGTFPEISIQQAWRSEKMNELRGTHVPNQESCQMCNVNRRNLLKKWSKVKQSCPKY